MSIHDDCVLDVTVFVKALREAKNNPDLQPLLTLLGLCRAFSLACSEAIKDRVVTVGKPSPGPELNGWVSVSVIARHSSMSRQWFYRNADRLPFAKKVGNRRVFNIALFDKWLETQR